MKAQLYSWQSPCYSVYNMHVRATLSARVNDGSVGDHVGEPLFWIPLSEKSNDEIQQEKSGENWQPRFRKASYEGFCVAHIAFERLYF